MLLYNSLWLPDSTPWEWSRPLPEMITGRKLKGTETCGHAMMQMGTSLMTGSKLTCTFHADIHVYIYTNIHMSIACVRIRVGRAGASRLGLHGHWVAAQVKWTKALPTLHSFSISSHNIQTHTHGTDHSTPVQARGKNVLVQCRHISWAALYILRYM